jgi:hypothetical protein
MQTSDQLITAAANSIDYRVRLAIRSRIYPCPYTVKNQHHRRWI